MTHQTKTFTIADPRTFDGDPYEVAERAVAQAAAIHVVYQEALDAAFTMARNAEMERQLSRGEDPAPLKFVNGPHGNRFAALLRESEAAQSTLSVLRRAAGFNPKGKLDG